MKISQREAMRLKKRVSDLEANLKHQRNSWSSDWPGGVNIATLTIPETSYEVIRTARKLGHAVVVVNDDRQSVRFMAVKN